MAGVGFEHFLTLFPSVNNCTNTFNLVKSGHSTVVSVLAIHLSVSSSSSTINLHRWEDLMAICETARHVFLMAFETLLPPSISSSLLSPSSLKLPLLLSKMLLGLHFTFLYRLLVTEFLLIPKKTLSRLSSLLFVS